MSSSETFRPVYAGRSHPKFSYGIPFPAAAARRIPADFHASSVYIICSGSLARNTHSLERLVSALEAVHVQVVGKRIGMTSHTMWSEVLEVAHEASRVQADLLLTVGAGTLTDASKVAALVAYRPFSTDDDD